MSTSSSSSSSSSANTGPNRFRADAASFSPQQLTNYGNYRSNQPPQPQQFYNPQHHQMYMNYGVPVYPYVIPPPQYYYGGPTEYYPPYPPQPYLNNSHSRGKFGHQNHHNHNDMIHPANIPNTQTPYPTNISHSRDYPYSYRDNHTNGSSTHAPSSNGSTSNATNSSISINKPIHNKSSKVGAKTTSNDTTKNVHPGDVDKSPTTIETGEKDIKPSQPGPLVSKPQSPIKFPIYINEESDKFNEQHKQILSIRKSSILKKYNHLNNLKFDKMFNVLPSKYVTIDYNSHNDDEQKTSVTSTPKVQKESTPMTKESTPTAQITEVQSPLLPSSNWASILQAAPPSRKTPSKTKTTEPSSNNNDSRINTNVPTIKPMPQFNISQESSQPLGILLLRIMFDANYSVYSPNLPKYPIKPHGLLNTGNICYMNSILQVLIFCQPFNLLFKLIQDKSVGSLDKVSETPLTDATIKFFQEFVKQDDTTGGFQRTEQNDKKNQQYEDTKPISPDSFYMNLINHKKFQHLKWGQQEDAEEFLGYYLDGLNEEFVAAMKKLTTTQIDELIQNYSSFTSDSKKVQQFKYNVKSTIKIIKKENNEGNNGTGEDDGGEGEWNEVGANNKKTSINKPVEFEPTPINQIFGGQFKSVLTIPRSSNSSSFQKSITFDPFQNVQLDISEVESIEQAFINLNQLEKISYKSNNNQEVQIKKQTFIDKLPEILIIHLKRFSFLKEKEVGIEKLRKKIEYSHELNIPGNLISNKSIHNSCYRLTGVVYHHGVSATGGHYTCDVLQNVASIKENTKQQEDWIRIDDTLLKPITEHEVLNGGSEENIKNAYLLFYERV